MELFRILLLIFLLSVVADPSHAFDITFRSSAIVTGTAITLDDIADFDRNSELAKALAGQTVAASPEAGQKIDLDCNAIVQKIAKTITTSYDIRWLGSKIVTVQRQGVTITSEEIQGIINDFITAKSRELPQAIYTFTPTDPPLPFMIPTGQIQWDVTPSNPGIIGSSRFALIGRIDNQVIKNFSIRGTLEALAPVAVAATSLRRDTILTEADIRMEPRDLSTLRTPCLQSGQVIGKKLLRHIQAGAVIDLASIEFPPMIKKGALVKIFGRKNGLELTATGIARTDGQEGQVIKVKNTSSDKDIFCRVTAPGLVEVQI